MIADLNADTQTLDVIYTTAPNHRTCLAQEEEDDVSPDRVRLVPDVYHDTRALEIQLLMNAAKCSEKLNQLEHVMTCCSDVLALEPTKWQALYLRAISAMERGQLTQAKADLWTGHAVSGKTRNPWITKAWTRLQFLMKKRKRQDRRLTKDMLRYVSTIPGLNLEEE